MLPDAAVLIWSRDQRVYYAVAVLWSFGYVVDPIVYIFASKDSRDVARLSVTQMTKRIGAKLSVMSRSTDPRLSEDVLDCESPLKYEESLKLNVKSHLTVTL